MRVCTPSRNMEPLSAHEAYCCNMMCVRNGNVCIEVELGLLASKLVAIPIPIPIRTDDKVGER